MGEVRKIRRLKAEWDIRAVGTFPVGCTPQVDIGDPKRPVDSSGVTNACKKRSRIPANN